jgi:ABC-type oligopeptide transport system ATPase subunit
MRVLRRVEPKMLIFDEAHDLLAGSYREQRCALNLLKGLANELRIPVVAVGTEDARHAIQTDPQVASRFDPMHLTRWKESTHFAISWTPTENYCRCAKPQRLAIEK